MKMKAKDQLHLSALGPNTMAAGTEFDVSDALAEELEKKGLATRVDAPAEAEAEKAEATPANKAEPTPANKAESRAPSNKSRRRK